MWHKSERAHQAGAQCAFGMWFFDTRFTDNIDKYIGDLNYSPGWEWRLGLLFLWGWCSCGHRRLRWWCNDEYNIWPVISVGGKFISKTQILIETLEEAWHVFKECSSNVFRMLEAITLRVSWESVENSLSDYLIKCSSSGCQRQLVCSSSCQNFQAVRSSQALQEFKQYEFIKHSKQHQVWHVYKQILELWCRIV